VSAPQPDGKGMSTPAELMARLENLSETELFAGLAFLASGSPAEVAALESAVSAGERYCAATRRGTGRGQE
jgi:hypothetical protein